MNNTINKSILISNIKTLVDLNEDDVIFDIDFKVTSKNNEPFIISVVDQNTLDNQENLEYKEIDDGYIAGNVKNNKNVYQNYFLCLKSLSESEIECDVEIIRKTPPEPIEDNIFEDREVVIPESSSYNKNYYNCICEWKWYILYTLLIIIFFYLIYYNSNKLDKKNITEPNNTNIDSSMFSCGISSTSIPSKSDEVAKQFKMLYSSSSE